MRSKPMKIKFTPLYIGRTFPIKIVSFFVVILTALFLTVPHTARAGSMETMSSEELLKKSQISYSADGGFSGVKSYGVIVSCVNGKISMLKTIHDPRHNQAPIRHRGNMDQTTYLRLWDSLVKHKVLEAKNIAEPKMDIADEFTIQFEARVGSDKNTFQVHGIARPEASQHFAIKSLIDYAVQMHAFAGTHDELALK